MSKNVNDTKLKGVKKPFRLRQRDKARNKAAQAATTRNATRGPVNPQAATFQNDTFSDGEASDFEIIDLDERERFKRLIRLTLNSDDDTMGRRLLVTGGATVPFVGLLEEVTGEDFLKALQVQGFTHVYLQCGGAHEKIETRLKDNGRGEGLQIETFAYCRDLKSLMKEHCRGEQGVRPAGVVIGHAGTGTISDAMEVDCALVIVANSTLMDDHQSAFAAEMATENPTIVQGHLGNLINSIPEVIGIIKKNGLDDLGPYEEPSLSEEQQLTFIDEVVAGATRPQRCIVQ